MYGTSDIFNNIVFLPQMKPPRNFIPIDMFNDKLDGRLLYLVADFVCCIQVVSFFT